jgi:hypothetical protein
MSLSSSDWMGRPRLGGNAPWGTKMGQHVYGVMRAAGEEQWQRHQCEGTAEVGSDTAH